MEYDIGLIIMSITLRLPRRRLCIADVANPMGAATLEWTALGRRG